MDCPVAGFDARFRFCYKIQIHQRGKSVKQKLLEMVQVTVLFHTFPPLKNRVFFCLTKTETTAKTAPRAPKLGYKGGRAPQLSAWGTLVTSEAGVV